MQRETIVPANLEVEIPGAVGAPAYPEAMSRKLEVDHTPPTFIESAVTCGVQAVCWPFLPCFLTKVDDFERAVVLRFGKTKSEVAGAGGLYVVWPVIDRLIKVDIRETTMNVSQQALITSEGLTVVIDAVVYFRVTDAVKVVFGVQHYRDAVQLLSQTKLREVLGFRTFEQLQKDREGIAEQLKFAIDEPTDPWGIDVTRVEITDVKLPKNIQRAMGQEAEAMRNAHAKVIEANGEKKAAQILLNAANIMEQHPEAMQLRFLQTLSSCAAENNKTVIIPYPAELGSNPAVLQSLATGVSSLSS